MQPSMMYNQPMWTPFLMLIVGGVIFLWFIGYFFRYRYPPLVRKMRDLRWEIRVGRDPRRILVRNLRPRSELLADTFHHAMYPVTGDARYICGLTPWRIDRIPYSILKKAYRARPTCQELLLELEQEESVEI